MGKDSNSDEIQRLLQEAATRRQKCPREEHQEGELVDCDAKLNVRGNQKTTNSCYSWCGLDRYEVIEHDKGCFEGI